MGAQIETTDGHLPLTVTGGKLRGDRLRAARRERAGQVGHPARRSRRRGADDRDRACADARPHRADAARRGRARDDAAQLRGASTARRASSSARSTCRATSRRRRRSSSPRPWCPSRGSAIHDVNLNPRRTGLLDVLERMGARVGDPRRGSRIGSRAGGDARGAPRGGDRDDDQERARCRCSSTSCRSSGCSRRRAAARAGSTAPVSCAEGDRPHRRARRRAEGDRRTREGARGRLLGHRRPDPPARRQGRRRAATIGSRCSGPLQGSGRAKGYAWRTPRAWRYPSPASTSSSTDWRRDDRCDRWPRRGGQEHCRPPPRRAARLPLPGHRGDVPRADLARVARGAPARGRAIRSATSRARTPSPSTRSAASSSRAPT